MKKFFHSFHLVTMSPWPLFMGIGVMGILLGLVKVMSMFNFSFFFFSMIFSFMVMVLWWRDVIREGTYEGSHSLEVVKGMMVGMILFIISEVFFFFSFFWSFFHSSLNPTLELGGVWPPSGVESFNPFQVPLLNTTILLSSGVSITWCHQSILKGEMEEGIKSLMITWMLGIYFLFLQWMEYNDCSFSISDSVFGSIFFVATGFHGFHVIVGTLFLMVIWMRLLNKQLSEFHHFGFEASAWYWHFVDVVWLFLFSVVYWWGG